MSEANLRDACRSRQMVNQALACWGWDLTGLRPANPQSTIARVVRVDRGECDAVTDDGMVRVLSDSQRAQNEVAPVTGDWVELALLEGLGLVIERILPRRTSVARRDPAERDVQQVLASNVDVVAAVLSLDRPVQAGWLERLLVVAMASGAEPLIVLTKADLADAGSPSQAIVEAVAGEVDIVRTSVETGTGLAALLEKIGPSKTLAMIGESGVGKSSLANALMGDDRLAVGEVRSSDSEGRHTTTARELIKLPDDHGLVLDTPGIRTLGLWEAENALDLVFGDVVERASYCRFRDCAHVEEPGCAVLQAVTDGEMSPMRVELFGELVEELEGLRRREEQRARKSSGTRPGRRRR